MIAEGKPRSKQHLGNVIVEALRKELNDPTVQIMTEGLPQFIVVRVAQDASFRRFRIDLVEER